MIGLSSLEHRARALCACEHLSSCTGTFVAEYLIEQATANYIAVLHFQGQGMVCVRAGGIPAGAFVAEYLGELYPPWRWFEKQDEIKKRGKAGLPDFYNISLERPKDDDLGYDVLFVEVRGYRPR